MLTITIPKQEFFNERTNEFVYAEKQVVKLEHSLLSIQKWEEKYHKPYLDNGTSTNEKTLDETMDYIRCMTISPDPNKVQYFALTQKNIQEINEYIKDTRSAARISEYKKQESIAGKDYITADIIYYWLVALQIPFEVEKWHLNRLLTLITIINIKNDSENKLSKKDVYARNAEINEINKRRFGIKD